MQEFILRRFLWAIPVILVITLLSFAFFALLPGDAIIAMLVGDSGRWGGSAGYIDEKYVEQLREEYGLNAPLPIRYLRWLRRVVTGDLGYRFKDRKPVATLFRKRLPPTMELMGLSLLLAVVFGIPMGIISSLKHNTLLDYVLTAIAFLGRSIPSFFLGMIVIYLFGVRLGWLPVGGLRTPATPFSLKDHLQHLILPSITLTMVTMGDLMRYARASMLEVIQEDYITTARGKGLYEKTVIMRHAFRNALLPLITIIGYRLSWLVGGTIIVETLFQWPGMGMLYIGAVHDRDYFVVMAFILFSGIGVILGNLVADVVYAVVDPRIRYR